MRKRPVRAVHQDTGYRIRFNADVPCAAGEILYVPTNPVIRRRIAKLESLPQLTERQEDELCELTQPPIVCDSDWGWPSFASDFGWSLGFVQWCPVCQKVTILPDREGLRKRRRSERFRCQHCDGAHPFCDHDATDGTIACRDCGLAAGEFMSAAYDWLKAHDGAVADDPGYFDHSGSGTLL